MNYRNLTAAFIMVLMLFSRVFSGNPYHGTVLQKSKLSLKGTSTMHDYACMSSQMLGTVVIDSEALAPGAGYPPHFFGSAEMTIPIKQISSGKDKLDDKMYELLVADDHPNITYRLTRDSVISGNGKDTLSVQTKGKLSVAGKENVIDMTVMVTTSADGVLSITGQKDLLMTDFNIEPPTMMFGMLKTDNKIVIDFTLFVQFDQHIQSLFEKGK